MTAFILSPIEAASWGRNGLWSDKRAEVAIYESVRVVDGKPRSFRETVTTIKEDRAFKMNQIQKIDLENYPQNDLVSVFVRDDSVSSVLKLTASQQNWVGASIQAYTPGDMDLGASDYFEDQLPLSLRGLDFRAGEEQTIRLWRSFLVNRSSQPVEAVLSIFAPEPVHCRAGTLKSWKVQIRYKDGADTYWFEDKYPHILTKMETQDGRKRLLYGRARWSYWDRRLPMPNVLK